ncbi:MAG: preprotein translocase subunit SecG [Spirochaetaceae bacterium]|jgi:preprotein translocase subunit SecG|nr:preprotein translocase subunit SecG [Spirochaetaceae bacterium]
MGVLGILLLVVFIIIAVLLVLLVLVQNEEGDSLGGIFAGGSGSAFGSRSGNVLTRATSILGALFLVLSLGLALLNRSGGITGIEAAGREQSAGQESDWFMNNDTGDVNIDDTTGNTGIDDVNIEENAATEQ